MAGTFQYNKQRSTFSSHRHNFRVSHFLNAAPIDLNLSQTLDLRVGVPDGAVKPSEAESVVFLRSKAKAVTMPVEIKTDLFGRMKRFASEFGSADGKRFIRPTFLRTNVSYNDTFYTTKEYDVSTAVSERHYFNGNSRHDGNMNQSKSLPEVSKTSKLKFDMNAVVEKLPYYMTQLGSGNYVQSRMIHWLIFQNIDSNIEHNSSVPLTLRGRAQETASQFNQSTLVSPVPLSFPTNVPYLNLSTSFFDVCFGLGQPVTLPPAAGDLLLDIDKIVLQKSARSSDLQCSLRMTLPANISLRMDFTDLSWWRAKALLIELKDETGYRTQTIHKFSRSWVRRIYTNPGAKLRFTLTLLKEGGGRGLLLGIKFTPIHKSSLPGLEKVLVTPLSGYVQSPGFDGHTLRVLIVASSWATVKVPHSLLTLLSTPFLQIGLYGFCRLSSIEVYANWNIDSPPVTSICQDSSTARIFIQHARYIHVHFSNTYFALVKGFRLMFSFHDQSTRLQKVAGGLWNCSVPSWPEYLMHFTCNLEAECVDKEDEIYCPYSSPLCRPGYFKVSNKCYTFVTEVHGISWNAASRRCRLQSSHHISLNTPEEWEAIDTLFKTYRSSVTLLLGLRTASSNLPIIYRHQLQQADGRIAYYIGFLFSTFAYKPSCFAVYVLMIRIELFTEDCNEKSTIKHFMCESQPLVVDSKLVKKKASKIAAPTTAYNAGSRFAPTHFVSCPQHHLTHVFLACDERSACWIQESGSCPAPLTPLPPSFLCRNGHQRVSYSLVCDFRSDCNDNSDEDFCTHKRCLKAEQFECLNAECVPYDKMCNEVPDCVDGSDEMQCSQMKLVAKRFTVKGPSWVNFTQDGKVELVPISTEIQTRNTSHLCPANYYACDSVALCLPIFTRCNRVYDCPGREDEADCGIYTCPGFYRCLGSSVCLTRGDLCDKVYHCPLHDDELMCDLTCPQNCMCQGLTFFCHRLFRPGGFPFLRYLDASGTGLIPNAVMNNTLLIYLSLARCGLLKFGHLALPNLHSLDLSDNLLTEVTVKDLSHLSTLKHLTIAGNPFVSIFGTGREKGVLTSQGKTVSLQSLDLSRVLMPVFHVENLFIFPTLETLNLSGCGVDRLVGTGLDAPNALNMLDMRGCPLTHFQPDLFQSLYALEAISGDNYRLCCPQMLRPDFNLAHCRAPSDEVSSCQSLLRSHIYRIFLVLFAGLALSGNVVVFVSRALLSRPKNGFEVFIINLCMSDFLMGVYLVIIGVADYLYKGSYLWNDVFWRHSATCSLAGFLSMVSNEVSAFVICLITLDRFLVLRFPFSRVRFSKTIGIVTSVVVWMLSVVLAVVPLLPSNAHWQFYSVNGICVPLPITRKNFPGHHYSFSVMIVYNFILFLFIALGQIFIFLSVQKNSMRFFYNSTDGKTVTKNSSKDLTLARRLFTIALTDFLCWFPISLLGLLASSGVSISGEVNVAIAIFVLPLNSAINPFMYTINKLLEARRLKREQRFMNHLRTQLKQQASRGVAEAN